MSRPHITRPDWVIVGGTMSDGSVMLIASTELTQAELELRRQEHTYAGWYEFVREFRPRVTLAIEMKTYVIIVAATYHDALQNLFGKWQPHSPSELDGPQPLEIQR